MREQAGLGKVDEHALERSGGGAQSLLNAQASAKASKAGVWSVEPTEAEKMVRISFFFLFYSRSMCPSHLCTWKCHDKYFSFLFFHRELKCKKRKYPCKLSRPFRILDI